MNTGGNLFGGRPEFDKDGIQEIIKQFKKESKSIRDKIEYEFCPICRKTMNDALWQTDKLAEWMMLYSEAKNPTQTMFVLIAEVPKLLSMLDTILGEHGVTNEHRKSNPFDLD